ncbi:MAG: hypothetical protein JOZ29_11150 [Deltaproteobacteria bacterium]|nr:hypothetical protein [Deltaproteobacteria bacterium]
MSAPLVPSPLDYVGRRRFAFYPAIRNATPNEWVLGTGSRTEVQVINAELGYELWIPRQYVGAVSEGDGALLIVGLTKEIDLLEGSLQPRVKRVIEMPQNRVEPQKPAAGPLRTAAPAPVIGIRLEQTEPSRMSRAVVVLCIAAVLTALLAALVAAAARL